MCFSPISKFIAPFAVGASLIASQMTAPAASAQTQPNILVIMGDDIGMWNIGA
jgi:hypothetical protein